MRIGFVGLGLMGLPIARHLLDAGHALYISSSASGPRQELAARGATVCATPAAIAREVDVFFSCRVTPEHSRQTFTGIDGVAAAGRRLLCIDLATIDPETSRDIGRLLADKGIGFIDAPISGGPDGASAKSLSIIAGGSQDDMLLARPLFELFGKKVFHMGPVGTGVSTKLCNNMITITTHALLAEAMVLGVKSGIDADRLYAVLSSSSASSRTLERVVPNHFLNRDFKAAASITTIMKDLQCAIDNGHRLGVRLMLPKVAMQCFVDAAERGHAGDDIAAVILPMEEMAGVQVGSAKPLQR
jgi:3-hydroxyisobutyrate dehydrogenase-like beta-hydroxyacid dehydrogenase